MNATLLVAIYSYMHINVIELCSGMQKSYLKMDWRLGVLLVSLVRWSIAAFSQELVFPTIKAGLLILYLMLSKFWSFLL